MTPKPFRKGSERGAFFEALFLFQPWLKKATVISLLASRWTSLAFVGVPIASVRVAGTFGGVRCAAKVLKKKVGEW